jgi:hypothetical protein
VNESPQILSSYGNTMSLALVRLTYKESSYFSLTSSVRLRLLDCEMSLLPFSLAGGIGEFPFVY